MVDDLVIVDWSPGLFGCNSTHIDLMAQLHASMKRLSWLSLQSLKQLHLQRQARTRWLPLLSQTQAQRRSAHSDSQTSTSKNSKNVDQQQQAHDVGRQLREEWSTYSMSLSASSNPSLWPWLTLEARPFSASFRTTRLSSWKQGHCAWLPV